MNYKNWSFVLFALKSEKEILWETKEYKVIILPYFIFFLRNHKGIHLIESIIKQYDAFLITETLFIYGITNTGQWEAPHYL